MTDIDVSREDPRITALREQLETVELIAVISQTFSGQDVFVDGRRFVECQFIGCRLISGTGRFDVSGDHLIGGTSFTLVGPANEAHHVLMQFAAAEEEARRADGGRSN